MLIHLYTTKDLSFDQYTDETINEQGSPLHINLPSIYFQPGDNVEVNKIIIQWNQNVSRDFYGFISSSLVDRSTSNPKQQLTSFYHCDANITLHTPTHPEQYKIQCLSLGDSFFKLHLSEKPKKQQKIEKIYILLKISNDRF